MNGYGVQLTGVSYAYGRTRVLDDVTASIRPGVITGIIGRNGSGKSTLLNLIGGRRMHAPGAVLVNGQSPFTDADVIANSHLARHNEGYLTGESAATTFNVLADTRPDFSYDTANRLVTAFGINLRATPERMSQGERSAFAAAAAIASRCKLTVLDEVHLGMDAVTRRILWRELIADYAEHPRTVVMSSQLDEVEDLLEDVLVLVNGRLAESGEADAVRARHSTPGRVSSLTDVLAILTKGVSA